MGARYWRERSAAVCTASCECSEKSTGTRILWKGMELVSMVRLTDEKGGAESGAAWRSRASVFCTGARSHVQQPCQSAALAAGCRLRAGPRAGLALAIRPEAG